MDYSLPGLAVHVILQTRILQWVAIPFSRGSSQPRDRTWVAKSKGENERYTHVNAEFKRIARRDKKAFLSDQCKEIRKTTEWERLEMTSRKLEILREHRHGRK